MKPANWLDDHARLVLFISSVLIWLGIILLFSLYGTERTWHLWQIPAAQPSFVDFRIIPGSAETYRMGLDPMVTNPGDPMGRLFNLPRVWYLFFNTGITESDSVWISILAMVLFFVSIFWFFGELRAWSVLLMLLVLFSPAAMLLYERGNVDLFFLTLTALALISVDAYPAIAFSLILIGAIFKFYPILGVAIFLKEPAQKFQKTFRLAVVLFVGYLVLSYQGFMAALKLTEHGTGISYGVKVLADSLRPGVEQALSSFVPVGLLSLILGILPYLYILCLSILVIRLCIQNHSELPATDQRNLNAFRLGAAIYLGTFLVGTNWDYRLTFLIFVVPQLWIWITTGTGWNKRVPVLTLISILWSCWYMFFARFGTSTEWETKQKLLYILDEIVNWNLFLCLLMLFFASTPLWMRNSIIKLMRLNVG